MVKHALRLRLVLSIVALLLPSLVLAGWLLLRVFGDRLLRDLDVALDEEASTVAALIERPMPADDIAALVTRIAGETDLGRDKQVAVFAGDRLIAEAPAGASARLDADPGLRVALSHLDAPEGPLTVRIGVPASAAALATRRLRALLLAGIPATLLLLIAALWVVTSRALRPLEEAATAIETVGVRALDQRLPAPARDDEVGRIVVALNRMLDRLAAAVAQMQQFTADAAHELRTPIAVLRTGLDVALRRERTAEEYRTALSEALHDTERLDRLAEDLLTLARLESLPPRPPVVVDVGEMLLELADAYQPIAERRQVQIAVTATAALTVHGSSADLYRLFANLLENGIRHARAGGAVQVRVTGRGAAVEVTVADDGDGIPADELARVFDRFFRGRGEPRGGSGLGLSIARAIARAHDGEVRVDNARAGGCVATALLPRAGDAAAAAP